MRKNVLVRKLLRACLSVCLIVAVFASFALPFTASAADGVQAAAGGGDTSSGLPILFEEGLHYVVDPDYPDQKIVLYCMNNQLKWPHQTGETPHVPNYEEGYLTPDHFQSVEEYNECMRKLQKLLFAGYPYNGERLYKIVTEQEVHVPSEQEFNAMLIVPPQLENAFPYLGHHNFTLEDLHHDLHYKELHQFINEVAQMQIHGSTVAGLTYADIVSMPFYKATFCMTFNGNDQDVTTQTVRETFAGMYSSSYFVTEAQAYDATQMAVWRLMNAYGVENNDIGAIVGSELGNVLWQYCQNGGLLMEEPSSEQIAVEGDLMFEYNPKDGLWHSGMLKLAEPADYNGLYVLDLPEGVYAKCENLTYVYGNEEYELISQTLPKKDSNFSVHAGIDWLKDMRQYSPVGDDKFQHMVGAVMCRTPISKTFPYDAAEGTLEISKTVVGEPADPQKAFSFQLALPDTKLNGQYGDVFLSNGVASFELRSGETITVPHLPADARYMITEDSEGYLVNAVNAEGTIQRDRTVSAQFENVKLNSLLLSKTVAGEAGEKDRPFTFEVEILTEDGTPLQGNLPYTGSVKSGCEQESQAPQDGELTFRDGKAVVTLSHGQQIQIRNIPYSCTYSVREIEADQDGYTTTYQGAVGNLNTDAQVHVINTKNEEPTDPSEPEQPDKPTDPSEPEQPDKPTEPSEPEQPDKPTEPSEPEQPDKPTDPSEPEQPDKPTDPSEPKESENPTEPAETEKPVSPVDPEGPAQTGDESALILWSTLAMAALLGIAVLAVRMKKRSA